MIGNIPLFERTGYIPFHNASGERLGGRWRAFEGGAVGEQPKEQTVKS